MYCLREGFLEEGDYPEEQEYDHYDERAIHFVAVNKENEVIGTMRIINASLEKELPCEEKYDLADFFSKHKRESVGEISRLVIRPEYRGTNVLFSLIAAGYMYCREEGIVYWMGVIEEWLYRYMQYFIKGAVKCIGEKKFVFNTWNYPVVISLEEALLILKKRYWFVYPFIKHKIEKHII
jgi:GNAT superfamily N-acetyltransferase